MKKHATSLVIAAVILVAVVVMYKVQPPRVTPEQRKDRLARQRQLDEIEAQRKAPEEEPVQEEAKPEVPAEPMVLAEDTETEETATPEEEGVFKVKFECSNGDFVVEVHEDWAPLGAERFRQLVEEEFFTDVRFFRVVTDFVVQFGISGDPAVSAKWRNADIKDDPVKQSNTEGMLTYACAGPNSRTTQLFINLKDNSFLDNQGFPPIGKVVEGMDVVQSFNGQYQDKPTNLQHQIQKQGNAFLDERFPGLDYIKSAKFVD